MILKNLIKITHLNLFLYFLMLILICAFIFKLPIMVNANELSFIDAFFTSSSALCSLGQLPFEFLKLSSIGKAFLSILIQIGGIGILIIMLSFIFLVFNKKNNINAKEIDFVDSLSSSYYIKKFLKFAILMTLSFELFGVIFYKISAFLLNIHITWSEAIFYSINIFCNAGFYGTSPNIFFLSNFAIIYVINSILLIGGGLGFFVLFEILFKKIFKNEKNSLTITTKFALIFYSSTTLVAWFIYGITCENELSFLSVFRSLFTALSLKSLGIFPYDMAISNSILLFTSFYDLIGTAPLGTGKGLKSSVIIILLYLLKELILTGKNKIVICGKKISQK